MMWQRRNDVLARAILGGTVVLTSMWSASLLGRATNWNTWLAPTLVVGGIVPASRCSSATVLLPDGSSVRRWRLPWCRSPGRRLGAGDDLDPARGSIVTAGPAVSGAGFGPGRAGGRLPGGNAFPAPPNRNGNGFPVPPNGNGNRCAVPGRRPPAGGRGGGGGLLNASEPSAEVVATLLDDSDQYTWVAATIGSNEASGFQLATDAPVMPIGGFNGSDPSPTLEQFQQYVAQGPDPLLHRRRWFRSAERWEQRVGAISNWVEQNFTATTIDGVTLYYLSA